MLLFTGYEELTAGPAGVEYSKGYNSSSQAQAKSAAAGPGKGKMKNPLPNSFSPYVLTWKCLMCLLQVSQ